MAINDADLNDLRSGMEENHGLPFAMDDVAELLVSWTDRTGGYDEPNFAWLLRLKDGRFAVATGWHDSTGWDCQSNLTGSVHETWEDAVRFGFTVNDRENLGLLLPGESMADAKTPTT